MARRRDLKFSVVVANPGIAYLAMPAESLADMDIQPSYARSALETRSAERKTPAPADGN